MNISTNGQRMRFGGSFRYNNIAFKGSQIDRKFSYGNLKRYLRRI
ncbi:hypothetical protein [Dysgonomonas sp. GY617]|nr:hypothetical protein [Dysgonomonas sp. GY617]